MAKTIDLRSLRIEALDSGGDVVRLVIDELDMAPITALVGRAFTGVVASTGRGRTYHKPVVIKPGVRMGDAIYALEGFLRELETGESGDHMGRRSGIVFRIKDIGLPEEDPGRYIYVYQTATQIVVWY